MKVHQSVWRWVVGQVSGDVPVEDALCEFDCRKPQCFEGEWEKCMRRLGRAAGELMPVKAPAQNP
jgi:hypothetical protein